MSIFQMVGPFLCKKKCVFRFVMQMQRFPNFERKTPLHTFLLYLMGNHLSIKSLLTIY